MTAPPERPTPLDRREVRDTAARIVWLAFGDDMSVQDALSPTMDAHWRHWRETTVAASAFVAADAILALALSRLPDPKETP